MAYKIFTLYKRLSPITEKIIQEYQAEFRSGRFTINQLFAVKQTLSKRWKYNIDIHQIFGFQAGVNSIDRKNICAAMREFGIPEKLVKLIQITLCYTKAYIQVQNQFKNPMRISRGLKLAPKFFNVALEDIIKNLSEDSTC